MKTISFKRSWVSSCLDNSEPIASPNLAQPLHICDAILVCALREERGGLLLSHRRILLAILVQSARSSGFFLQGALVTFVRLQTSLFGSLG